MRGAVLLALVFSVCVWPDVLPSPQELHKAMLASYKDLGSFFAEVEETFAVDTYITFTPMQVWFSVPFIRIERKAEDSAMELPPLEIHDTARRKSWYLLFKARVWEEEEVLEFGQPLSLWALGLDYLREFQPETAFKERKNGETVYVLKGRLGKMEITVWLDPKTLFILQVIRRGGSLTWIHIIKNFQPGVEIAHELFQPPSLHEIARIYKLSPEGMEIAQKVGDRYRALQSFFMRKRILVEREVVNEEWIYWRPPFLRIELRTPPSPWFSPEVILVGLLDLQEGATYKYFAREDRWERYDLDLEEELGAEFALFAAARFFSGQPIVEVTEEILGQKRVWRLTGRGTPGTEAPPSQWWIDQETFQIVQYAEAYPMVQRPTDQLQWGVRTVQIVQFEENGKYLRSSSPNPRRSPLLTASRSCRLSLQQAFLRKSCAQARRFWNGPRFPGKSSGKPCKMQEWWSSISVRTGARLVVSLRRKRSALPPSSRSLSLSPGSKLTSPTL